MQMTSLLPAAVSAVAGATSEAVPAAAAAVAGAGRAIMSASAARAALPQDAAALAASKVIAGLTRAGARAGTTTARRTSAGYAVAPRTVKKATVPAATASRTSGLGFLSDPRLSIEEKLIRLMGYLNGKWEKQMQEKLQQIGAGEGTAAKTSTSTSSKSKSTGVLGGIASVFSSALGAAGGVSGLLKVSGVKTALKKLGGPVLAAAASAFGFPAAAPLLLQYGSSVVDAAMGVASAVGTASKASQASSGTGAMSDSERQTLLMEIQRIQDKQKEMFGLVSNILKSNHDSRLSIINNIR